MEANIRQQIDRAVEAIRNHWKVRPRVGIVLGTGLGELVHQIAAQECIACDAIPHFPTPTAPSHRGQLVGGTLCGVPVVAMDGRVHLYEGYSPAEVSFGVRVMAALGVELLIASNACGGMNLAYRPGDVMVLDDHINFTFGNPLVGPNQEDVDCVALSRPYDPRLIERALAIARQNNFVAHRGVYVGVVGPNYETRAEYRMFRRIGGDAVGMSTVPEVIAAVQCGLRVLALSIVTNVCFPDQLQSTDAQHVIDVAASAEPKLRAIILGILAAEALDASEPKPG